jgi:hypothetical protein
MSVPYEAQDEDAEFPPCRSLNPEGHGSGDSLPHPDAAKLDRIPLARATIRRTANECQMGFAELGLKD